MSVPPRCRRAGGVLVLVVLLLTATGCQLTRSAFANQADEVGSEFAAAAATLRYLHEGKVTRAFTEATFVNYASAVQGAGQKMVSAGGAPDDQTLQQLLQLYDRANEIIQRPCLAASCDWEQQVDTLRQASDALLASADAG